MRYWICHISENSFLLDEIFIGMGQSTPVIKFAEYHISI